MTKTVKGAGRGRYAANKARHDQRTPFTDRPVHAEHTAALRLAAGHNCRAYQEHDHAEDGSPIPKKKD